MIINCTKCGASINSSVDEISKAFIKCPKCGFWEDLQECSQDLELKCPSCDAYLSGDTVFCSKCGSRVIPHELVEITFCEKCGAEYEITDKFCKHDGTQLSKKMIEASKASDNPNKNSTSSNGSIIEKSETGFGFATLWVILQSIGAIFWVIFGIYLTGESDEPFFIILTLLGIPSAITAYGVFNRKKWGLYITYVYLALYIFGGFSKFFTGSPLVAGLTIIIGSLWILYFANRSSHFK